MRLPLEPPSHFPPPYPTPLSHHRVSFLEISIYSLTWVVVPSLLHWIPTFWWLGFCFPSPSHPLGVTRLEEFSGEWACVMEKNLEGLHVGYSSSTLASPLAGSLRAFFLDPHSKNLVRFLKSKSMKPWRPQRFQPIVFSYSDCYSCSVSSSDSLKLLVAWSYCRFYWLLLLSKSQGHVCLFSFLLYHFSL